MGGGGGAILVINLHLPLATSHRNCHIDQQLRRRHRWQTNETANVNFAADIEE